MTAGVIGLMAGLWIFPPWEFTLFDEYTIPSVFLPTAAFLPLPFLVAALYPALERRFTGDDALHNLLQRPRDVPVRTSLGAMAVTFYVWLVLCAMNDWVAHFFHVSLNATMWAGRIGLVLLPPLAYWSTYRVCLGLQLSDRAVLALGIETGIVRRLPHGEFVEVHQPLGGVDEHGRPLALEYQGAPVPKRMNQLGASGAPVAGSLLRPDPAAETGTPARREPPARDELAARPSSGGG